MTIRNFEELFQSLELQEKVKVGIVNAIDQTSIGAMFHPRIKEYVEPVLIGDTAHIMEELAKQPLNGETWQIIDAENEQDAAEKAVQLAKEQKIAALMKGKISTRQFLLPVVKKETGIIADSFLTHVVLEEIPGYPKLLLTSDGGMVPEPTLTQKKQIIRNAIHVMHQLGYTQPKVALLAAAETVNPKIASSEEADELMHYFQEEEPMDCWIDGPISLDLAVSPEIAKTKGYSSPVAGDADILIGPDMTSMNILGKSLSVFAHAKMAGIICGAAVPIIMTSRGSSVEEKINSILLAILLRQGDKHE